MTELKTIRCPLCGDRWEEEPHFTAISEHGSMVSLSVSGIPEPHSFWATYCKPCGSKLSEAFKDPLVMDWLLCMLEFVTRHALDVKKLMDAQRSLIQEVIRNRKEKAYKEEGVQE